MRFQLVSITVLSLLLVGCTAVNENVVMKETASCNSRLAQCVFFFNEQPVSESELSTAIRITIYGPSGDLAFSDMKGELIGKNYAEVIIATQYFNRLQHRVGKSGFIVLGVSEIELPAFRLLEAMRGIEKAAQQMLGPDERLYVYMVHRK